MSKRMSELEPGLTPKEDAFCVAFTDVEADTYGNGTLAAKKAGYSAASAHNAAWKLRRRAKVQARLNELYDENAGKRSLTPSRVLSDIEDTRRRAITGGDLAVAIRCSELTGKFFGMFSDRLALSREEPERSKELSAAEQREATLLATLRLRLPMSPVFELPGNSSETGEKQGESNGTDTPLQALLTDGQDAAGKVASPPEQPRRVVPLFTPISF